MFRACLAVAAVACAAATLSGPAAAWTNYQIAGLQIGLYRYGYYGGAIDGIDGPQTEAAIRKLQRAAGLEPDGVVGKRTRAALGKFGRPGFGSRVLKRGMFGFDVSVLQFLLAKQGFPPEALNSKFGPVTERQVRRFQRKAGLAADGIVGKKTRAALLGVPKTRTTASRRVVRVRPGETLTAIAARHGTTVGALAKRNRLDPQRVLLIGARLVIPARVPAGSASVKSSINRWAAHYGVDASLARALAWQESGWQSDVRSPAGAVGVMQVTPPTWEFVELFVIGQQVPHTTDGNIRIGVAYLDHLLREFRGDVRLALAGYYQGPAAVRRDGLFAETKRFVGNVLALRGRV